MLNFTLQTQTMRNKLFLLALTLISLGVSSQNITFPDANFKDALLGTNSSNFVLCYDSSGNNILADQNGDGEIQLSEAAQIYKIEFRQISNYGSLEGINSFVNLESILYINDSSYSHIHGYIGDISLDGLSHLKTVNLSDCDVSKASFKNCPVLSDIKSDFRDSYNTYPDPNIHGNTLELTVNNCPKLNLISWTNNNVASANITVAPELKHLELRGNSLISFDASQLTNLEYLDLSNNQANWGPLTGEANFNPSLTSVNISGLTKLNYLNASHQLLNNQGIDLSQLISVNLNLDLSYNDFNSEIVINSPILDYQSINFSNNKITGFTVNADFSAQYYSGAILDLSNNLINNVKFGTGGQHSNINLSNNPLTQLDCPLVKAFYLNFDQTNVNYINLLEFEGFSYKNCTAESLKIKGIRKSYDAPTYISENQNLREIDFSNIENAANTTIKYVNDNPILHYINFKNGSNNVEKVNFTGNPNLKYICADDEEIPYLISGIATMGLTGVNINSYCTFTPGGNFNTITGTVKIDADNNGCDANDNPFEYLKLKISDGTNFNSGETFVKKNGKYEFYTQAGNYTVTAQAENPALFTISPASFSANFADNNNNVSTQDICVTANGSQNDAEVVIAPLTNARPGFDASYNLVWRNKGNTILSGKVVLNYDSNKMVFKSSALPYSVISSGSIEFDYANLKPYENRAVEITFTINTPTDANNPVNGGDVLAFNSHITPSNPDLTPNDNYFSFNHTVVNSFDPNDIVCLQGETIPSTAVGKYLNYVVNFENTGSAEAENVVVKMEIDPSEFDINTLQLMNSSAPVETIINGNNAEFKFSKIKLPTGGHGGILLKMKSNATLVEGDSVNNQADIYFDYNFPVETNDYVTTIKDTNNILAAKISYNASAFSQNNYPVNFDASFSTGNITNYQWEFSGNPSVSSSTDVSPVVTYSVPGNYSAKLTVFDASNASSSQIINFNVGNSIANLSTGKDSDNNTIAIDSDEDDWIGYDINGTPITPKVRHTYPGWSYADLGNGVGSQWITLNNFEGYYTYKSKAFTIPENATDATLNLRSLSFVRNWTSLVKVNPDGSETETEITKTSWMSDGFKGWLNSRSPKVDNYSLSPGTYYIKVLLYSNNGNVRESLDVNAVVSCSAGLIYSNKLAKKQPTLEVQETDGSKIKVFPIPVKESVNIISKDKIHSVEIYDSSGRIVYKKILNAAKEAHVDFKATEGIYYLKIKTDIETITRKIIKE